MTHDFLFRKPAHIKALKQSLKYYPKCKIIKIEKHREFRFIRIQAPTAAYLIDFAVNLGGWKQLLEQYNF